MVYLLFNVSEWGVKVPAVNCFAALAFFGVVPVGSPPRIFAVPEAGSDEI